MDGVRVGDLVRFSRRDGTAKGDLYYVCGHLYGTLVTISLDGNRTWTASSKQLEVVLRSFEMLYPDDADSLRDQAKKFWRWMNDGVIDD